MSETPRTFDIGGKPYSPLSGKGGPRGVRGRFLIAVLMLVIVFVYWVGRDTHPAAQFIPADYDVRILLNDFVTERAAIGASTVWNILPQTEALSGTQKFLSQKSGIPEWVLRNLIGRHSSVVLPSIDATPETLLMVTRMSRVGCVLMRLQGLVPGIATDEAGGLDVYSIDDGALYAAVRGRVLIASPSRRALIYALTLNDSEHIDPETLSREIEEFEEDAIGAVLRFAAEEGTGNYLQSARCAVRLEEGTTRIRFRMDLREEWDGPLADIFRAARPTQLIRPIHGPMALSLDLGVSLKTLWLAIGDQTGLPLYSAEQWADWEDEKQEHTLPWALVSLLGPAGPGLRITWNGFDEDEILLVPELIATVDAERESVARFMESLPQPPQGSAMHPVHAQYIADRERMIVPTISGPSLEITAGWHGDQLLVGTSRPVTGFYLDRESGDSELLPKNGNLYLEANPEDCIRALAEAGSILAENGLLRDHTPESYADALNAWRKRAATVARVILRGRVQDAFVEFELEVRSREP